MNPGPRTAKNSSIRVLQRLNILARSYGGFISAAFTTITNDTHAGEPVHAKSPPMRFPFAHLRTCPIHGEAMSGKPQTQAVKPFHPEQPSGARASKDLQLPFASITTISGCPIHGEAMSGKPQTQAVKPCHPEQPSGARASKDLPLPFASITTISGCPIHGEAMSGKPQTQAVKPCHPEQPSRARASKDLQLLFASITTISGCPIHGEAMSGKPQPFTFQASRSE